MMQWFSRWLTGEDAVHDAKDREERIEMAVAQVDALQARVEALNRQQPAQNGTTERHEGN